MTNVDAPQRDMSMTVHGQVAYAAPVRHALSIMMATLLLTACSTGEEAPAKKTAETPEVAISGTVRVDSVAAVKYREALADCAVNGRLGNTLGIGESPVVIKDPNGKQVALGTISIGNYETYDSKGQEYISPGICNFAWDAGTVPMVDGIYTAEVPDLDIDEQFEPGRPVVIDFAP